MSEQSHSHHFVPRPAGNDAQQLVCEGCGKTERQVREEALIDKPMVCRVCGCTDDNACLPPGGPCHWVGNDLCSACSPEVTC